MIKQFVLANRDSGLKYPGTIFVPSERFWELKTISAFMDEVQFKIYCEARKTNRLEAKNTLMSLIVGEFPWFSDSTQELSLAPKIYHGGGWKVPERQSLSLSVSWDTMVPWCMVLTVEER